MAGTFGTIMSSGGRIEVEKVMLIFVVRTRFDPTAPSLLKVQALTWNVELNCFPGNTFSTHH